VTASLYINKELAFVMEMWRVLCEVTSTDCLDEFHALMASPNF